MKIKNNNHQEFITFYGYRIRKMEILLYNCYYERDSKNFFRFNFFMKIKFKKITDNLIIPLGTENFDFAISEINKKETTLINLVTNKILLFLKNMDDLLGVVND